MRNKILLRVICIENKQRHLCTKMGGKTRNSLTVI